MLTYEPVYTHIVDNFLNIFHLKNLLIYSNIYSRYFRLKKAGIHYGFYQRSVGINQRDCKN